jgi:hypothetical protein
MALAAKALTNRGTRPSGQRVRWYGAYSALMPAVLITWVQRSFSLLTKAV